MLLAVVAFYGGYVLPKLLKLSKFSFLVGNLRNLGSLGIVFHQQNSHTPRPPYSVGRVFTPYPLIRPPHIAWVGFSRPALACVSNPTSSAARHSKKQVEGTTRAICASNRPVLSYFKWGSVSLWQTCKGGVRLAYTLIYSLA